MLRWRLRRKLGSRSLEKALSPSPRYSGAREPERVDGHPCYTIGLSIRVLAA
jgi:hypothetical protein